VIVWCHHRHGLFQALTPFLSFFWTFEMRAPCLINLIIGLYVLCSSMYGVWFVFHFISEHACCHNSHSHVGQMFGLLLVVVCHYCFRWTPRRDLCGNAVACYGCYIDHGSGVGEQE
jgi:hypothetical protein